MTIKLTDLVYFTTLECKKKEPFEALLRFIIYGLPYHFFQHFRSPLSVHDL